MVIFFLYTLKWIVLNENTLFSYSSDFMTIIDYKLETHFWMTYIHFGMVQNLFGDNF